MKFARYLEETQTPEWKKAYIDYRGLKKKITSIRRVEESKSGDISGLETGAIPSPRPTPSQSNEQNSEQLATSSASAMLDGNLSAGVHTDVASTHVATDLDDEQIHQAQLAAPPTPVEGTSSRTSKTSAFTRLRRRNTGLSQYHARSPSYPQGERLAESSDSPRTPAGKSRGNAWTPGSSPPLRELLPRLVPVERSFFDMLNGELDKVESFYCAREREWRTRYEQILVQLQELNGHRRAFHEAHPNTVMSYLHPRASLSVPRVIPVWLPHPLRFVFGKHLWSESSPLPPPAPAKEETVVIEEKWVTSPADAHVSSLQGDAGTSAHAESSRTTAREEGRRPTVKLHEQPHQSAFPKYDPEVYHEARKQLKKAVMECYRGLEAVSNYRTLNLIGFRKALKKFEKVTRIPAMHAYTVEKIEPSAISSGACLDSMLREIEVLFAARFAGGDKKRAQARLRTGSFHKSHHFSTYRSGMLLGLAVPALVDGLVKSFQPEIRAAIPSWDGLLLVYAIFAVPIVFSYLIGINLLAWHNTRINYVFIFELDPHTRLDHREYFEIPSLLLCTLCYAFWLSFSRSGSATIEPSHWALLWLAWAMFVWLNPLPILFRPSRYWLVRNLFRQLTPGLRRVEFQDFWMGDQFCSLVFTLADLWFVGCAYSHELRDWQICMTGYNWGPTFALGALPLSVRLVQSIRRYLDSRQWTHLVNAGKYGTGVIYYMTYYLWRESGGTRGPKFVAWCIMGILYAAYAAAWDLLMDWSFFQPHAKYPLLRSEILYPSCLPMYYIAIVTNIIIRFEFVMYIPQKGISYTIRTFIAAMLEMLRRWQWNFFRLENEHLGNMDQYRVTREVPLPYVFDEAANWQESDGGDKEDGAEGRSQTSSWRRRR